MMVNNQITQLRNEANKYKLEFGKMSKEEHLQQEQLESSKSAEKRLKCQLGVDIDKMIITGGILSPNASESHLIARNKTTEGTIREKTSEIGTKLVKIKDNKKRWFL